METIPPVMPILPLRTKVKPDLKAKLRQRKARLPEKISQQSDLQNPATQPIDEVV